ncbi:MAG: NYN domain-containing protein [Clostridiales bacterium]|mgnify:CR=1 FL=1|nr:NYN domain-containing protein [Clostridiales bacterium]
MFKLFKRRNEGKPRAIAFVDYEHWYIALDNMYNTRPDIKAWREELAEKYDVIEIIFFADFSNQSLRTEIPRIREVSNYIVETQNATQYKKKDYTDFIMLDQIYQKAVTDYSIDVFILFTGDGHFSSAVSFIINRLRKEVCIYSIRGALSRQLKNTASYSVELPEPEPEFVRHASAILKNLRYIDDANKSRSKKAYPTFAGTVDAVARYYKLNKSDVSKTLRDMLDKGICYQTEETFKDGNTVNVLNVDWTAARRSGIEIE